MFIYRIPHNHQNLFLIFNFSTYTTFEKSYEFIFIQNKFYPQHFYNPNILKLVVYMNQRLFLFIENSDMLICNNNKSFKYLRVYIIIMKWTI
jgi:hypothetical protein